ncbi:related to chicken h-caldesmon, Uso1p and YKL201c [Cephalotrichum gorgonifer]|uniref:Related to chicken h-caldesmon, Uso1p and YKL201c n=1 Tax=Cephalotrichum gorgonifer TaxID=2041049 RepID=A0AAE8MPT0_9PEZI|nr:related to chicken h-caldesmon, Uso1p and YKL201c [Cephalotrichum gorgonifer]
MASSSDLSLLLDMGFEKERAELAIKRAGALNQALEWLEKNQDTPLDELLADAKAKEEDEEEEEEGEGANIKVNPSKEGGGVKSLVCNDCGKRFKDADFASYHASKTDHMDFSESSEEIAPLTEEEKKTKLEMLRQKLQEKRANQAVIDREEAKRNEQIRLKATKESQDVKEELQRKEQIKQAAKKRQDKLDDLEAKKRIRAKIEADKAERRRKAEEEKAAREGRAPESSAPAPPPAAAPPKKADHNEARLKLQTSQGALMKTLPAETTLFELAQLVGEEKGLTVTSFSTTFPRKTFEGALDFGKTLKEAGLVPSAVLNVK